MATKVAKVKVGEGGLRSQHKGARTFWSCERAIPARLLCARCNLRLWKYCYLGRRRGRASRIRARYTGIRNSASARRRKWPKEHARNALTRRSLKWSGKWEVNRSLSPYIIIVIGTRGELLGTVRAYYCSCTTVQRYGCASRGKETERDMNRSYWDVLFLHWMDMERTSQGVRWFVNR
jgi:hypothetical protein